MPARWAWACYDPRSLERLGLGVAESATLTRPPRAMRRQLPARYRYLLPLLDPILGKTMAMTLFRASSQRSRWLAFHGLRGRGPGGAAGWVRRPERVLTCRTGRPDMTAPRRVNRAGRHGHGRIGPAGRSGSGRHLSGGSRVRLPGPRRAGLRSGPRKAVRAGHRFPGAEQFVVQVPDGADRGPRPPGKRVAGLLDGGHGQSPFCLGRRPGLTG
jgi:hypothetical protein